MQVYVHVIDHPDARVLVDTGMTELHPAVADMDPRLSPLSRSRTSTSSASTSSSTHTCTSTTAAATTSSLGRPIHLQRRELDDARSEDDYTIREWVDAPACGTCRWTASSSCCRTPARPGAGSHARLRQVVVVDLGQRPLVIGGDVAVSFRQTGSSRTPKASCGCARFEPELVWLAHEHEPWQPAPSN